MSKEITSSANHNYEMTTEDRYLLFRSLVFMSFMRRKSKRGDIEEDRHWYWILCPKVLFCSLLFVIWSHKSCIKSREKMSQKTVTKPQSCWVGDDCPHRFLSIIRFGCLGILFELEHFNRVTIFVRFPTLIQTLSFLVFQVFFSDFLSNFSFKTLNRIKSKKWSWLSFLNRIYIWL